MIGIIVNRKFYRNSKGDVFCPERGVKMAETTTNTWKWFRLGRLTKGLF